MVFQITKSIVNDLLSWRSKLRELKHQRENIEQRTAAHLTRMSRQSMTQFRSNFPNFRQHLGGEWSQSVPVFFVTCKREHLTAQSHEFDTVSVIPPQHLDTVSCICQSQTLHICLSTSNVRRLIPIGSILRSMCRLTWIFEWMTIFEYRGNSTSSGGKDGRVREA